MLDLAYLGNPREKFLLKHRTIRRLIEGRWVLPIIHPDTREKLPKISASIMADRVVARWKQRRKKQLKKDLEGIDLDSFSDTDTIAKLLGRARVTISRWCLNHTVHNCYQEVIKVPNSNHRHRRWFLTLREALLVDELSNDEKHERSIE